MAMGAVGGRQHIGLLSLFDLRLCAMSRSSALVSISDSETESQGKNSELLELYSCM